MFTIRKATIDDRSLIHDLASRIWENTYGKILSKEQLDYMFDMMYAPDNILKQMEELHHQYFIILADDMPAGYLSIEKTGENTYNFQKIYSLPEMHGTGIGRFIIEQGINYLKEVHTGPFTIELYGKPLQSRHRLLQTYGITGNRHTGPSYRKRLFHERLYHGHGSGE